MEKKINIAELLKDCPKGMELDCLMYDFNIKLNRVDGYGIYPIKVQTPMGELSFNKYGGYSNPKYSKCVIFPKGKTTWEGFIPPCKFKDGDVITVENECGVHIFIYNHATEEEKAKFFQAIKDNSYKLVEPKFKVGDRIRHKETNKDVVYEISKVYDDSYGLVGFTWMIYMKYQDQYELVPNKFDITTLEPFESKVLVRSSKETLWKPAIFGYYLETACYPYYVLGGTCWNQCIPYKENEHLLGKTDDCDNYFKTWEK